MAEILAPGVYIEEVQFTSSPIEGVSTSTTGFIAITGRGPLLGPIMAFSDFERVAIPNLGVNLPLAVRGFFENGGKSCFISRIDATDPIESGLVALDSQAISIVCCPDDAKIRNAAPAMAAHCEKRKDRICILQSPEPIVPIPGHQPPVRSSYAAYYYPWIEVASLDGSSTVTIPPCGHLSGIYAQIDATRGVWVAPDASLAGVTALSHNLTAAESDELNSRGIDVIRSFPAQGIRVWGVRTTTNQSSDYKYISVRRLMIFIEQSIAEGTQWAVFEPNGLALWAVVRSSIEQFLESVWKQGALQGATQQEAFFVRCDPTTMTQDDLDNGRLVCIVGVAPLHPAEFVIIQIGVWTQYPPEDADPLAKR